jgi:predicted nucleic acid-binding Zn ribbon protein
LRPSRDRRPQAPQLVGELVPRLLQRHGIAAKVEAASVIPEWEELVGPGIAAVTRPVTVSDGRLVVAVATSPWMMELDLMKSQLMRRLNAGKRIGRIEELVFVMDG